MICTHKDTHEKYAVKTVQKNLEDPAKQREGVQRPFSRSSVRSHSLGTHACKCR
jgi:hypothetical protein